jgi:hypothetical protein
MSRCFETLKDKQSRATVPEAGGRGGLFPFQSFPTKKPLGYSGEI